MSASKLLCGAADAEAARQNRRAVCEPRGYCGPFINEEYFARFGDGAWSGTANCIVCGNTVDVREELEKWESSLWRVEFGRTVGSVALRLAEAG